MLGSACAARGARHGINVVASFYPLAEAAARVGGSLVQVENLTSPGVEPHDLELSPSQVGDIEDADAVLDMGRGFQPSVERAAARNHHRLEALAAISPSNHPGDPHVWLDPTQMSAVVGRVAGLLAAVDRTHAATYRANATRYQGELAALDERYRTGLASCAHRDVVTSHEAFGWLASRYGLRQLAISGLNPEAEPTSERLSQLVDLVRQLQVTTVFTETLLSPRAADTLAREAGVRTDVLNPIEGLTKADASAHATYVTLMDDNLAKLVAALGCT